VRDEVPGFCFLAEVYWDLEWTLQQQGFDYTYDKRLYDRLRDRHARPVREHFWAGLDYQGKKARFLENHDEPRAATFPQGAQEAAAVITFLSPGLRYETDLAPPGARPGRAGQPATGQLLRAAPRRAAPPRPSPGGVAPARMRPRLGGELDLTPWGASVFSLQRGA
jgi:hypothetical protein